MYLREFQIQGIKCFEDVTLRFPDNKNDYSGWIVLLGGNGMGKSTLLQAMMIAMVGPLAGQRLLFNPDGWVRSTRPYGEFSAAIVRGDHDVSAGQPRKTPYQTRFLVTGRQEVTFDNVLYDQPQLVHQGDHTAKKGLMSGPYAAKRSGWFSCGYGPFRRLLGGSSEESKLMFSQGRESRFVTLFREAAALTHCTEWLCALYSRSIDSHHPERARAGRALEASKGIINQLLPGSVCITQVDSEHAYFRSVGGAEVTVVRSAGFAGLRDPRDVPSGRGALARGST